LLIAPFGGKIRMGVTHRCRICGVAARRRPAKLAKTIINGREHGG
jgi:hypothetical protein